MGICVHRVIDNAKPQTRPRTGRAHLERQDCNIGRTGPGRSRQGAPSRGRFHHSVLRFLEKAMTCSRFSRESFEKGINCFACVEVIEQRLKGNSRGTAVPPITSGLEDTTGFIRLDYSSNSSTYRYGNRAFYRNRWPSARRSQLLRPRACSTCWRGVGTDPLLLRPKYAARAGPR